MESTTDAPYVRYGPCPHCGATVTGTYSTAGFTPFLDHQCKESRSRVVEIEDWDLGERTCSIHPEECESCQ